MKIFFSIQVKKEKSASSVKNQAHARVEDQPSVPNEPDTETENVYYAFLSKKSNLKICQLWDYINFKKREDCVLFYQEYSVSSSNTYTVSLCNLHVVMLVI